jgi:hypothetical protein
VNDWLKRAQVVEVDSATGWWTYLTIDEAGDRWVYSLGRGGMVRFNRLNPAHWIYWARSRWQGRIVVSDPA